MFFSTWQTSRGRSRVASLTVLMFHFGNRLGLLPGITGFGFSPVSATRTSLSSSCYCFPGDACWPDTRTWSVFNWTVGGRLTETVPIASVCHGSTYSVTECDSLQSNWFFPETHIPSSSSVMAPLFSNNSCNPFLLPEAPCTLGNYVSYAVRIRDASDARKTLAFAAKHRVRLVIRNTGHDYNGKSTGAGALSIWTRDLNTIELLDSYRQSWYSGRALRMGAGVTVHDAYRFADANDGIVVGGNCPTVGMAGGLSQGGGHNPLATKFSLASDQVLEWEVLSASGDVITATPSNHPDLYWALCGGGGGTYGVVLSMTVKLHPSSSISAAKLMFAMPTSEGGSEKFWATVKVFVQSLPAMVDAGLQVTWTLVPGALVVSPATAVGISEDTIDGLFGDTLESLDDSGIHYQYESHSFPSFLESYETMNLPGSNVSNSILGGRLLPRSAAVEDITTFMAALREIHDSNYVFAGLALNVSQTPADKVAANPYWRKTLINGVLGTFYNYSDYDINLKNQRYMTEVLIPKLDVLTKGESAAYLNEADFLEPDWKRVFYGENYERLARIKRTYDPEDRFYALGAVGSDRWVQKGDGRLCRA